VTIEVRDMATERRVGLEPSGHETKPRSTAVTQAKAPCPERRYMSPA